MKKGKKCVAIVLAAGSGKRMGTDIPKQYMDICGRPLLYYCLKTFQESFVDEIVIVTRKEDIEYIRDSIITRYSFDKVTHIVPGGAQRYHSVAAGLDTILENTDPFADCDEGFDYVFIHDGARPFVTQAILNDAFDAVEKYHAAVAGVPSKDTVKILDNEGFVKDTPNRNSVYIMQTPQVFSFIEIWECYRKLIESEEKLLSEGVAITDDAMVMEYFGNRKVYISKGDYRNIKVTTPEDIKIAELYVEEI